MNTSAFLSSLRPHASLPLLFRAGGEVISPGYHLTEVKRVRYETVDCGTTKHEWTETQFELWVPPSAGTTPGRGPMPADKFLRIVGRVERELALAGDSPVRILAAFAGQPPSLHAVVAVTPRDGQLSVELSPDLTRCKAAERYGDSAAAVCCGSGETVAEPAAAGCGCPPAGPRSAKLACCA